MNIDKDYAELLQLLNKHDVHYCIIGAYAVAFYAKPRFTKDIDIMVEPDAANASKLVRALEEFGFTKTGLTPADFDKEDKIVQLGYEPVRVDIVTSIDGCSFEKVWKNKKAGLYGNEKVFYIGINELIENKKTVSRIQDKMDVEALLAISAKKIKHKLH
ncbi:MAG: hypothetical protein HZA48_02410 [Planctomycetes bacterium]|nr:hypothetical protein [Planctomycetota bacterium]